MQHLFEPFSINGMKIRNRIARSATYEGLGNARGEPTRKLADLYRALAEGEVGLLITSAALIQRPKVELPEAAGLAYPIFMDRDELAALWRPLVAEVRARGATLAMQVVHPGRREATWLRGGEPPLAPSALQEKKAGVVPRAMTESEIREVVEQFGQACRRVKEAGFDGVQLHGGHDTLLNSFLSPLANVRTDAYGGDTARRSRIVLEVVRRARELVGKDFPILIKLGCDDFVPGGLEVEEAARVAVLLAEAGIDGIEITGGILETHDEISRKGIDREEKEAYFRTYAEALRKVVRTPLLLVGGMRSPAVIEKILSENTADMVSLSRPFIREPQLVKRWKEGDLRKAACVSCNQCRDNTFLQPLRCYVEEAIRRKKEDKESR
ncbi:MAG: NADH:flavin oxidoreductase [bacterium]